MVAMYGRLLSSSGRAEYPQLSVMYRLPTAKRRIRAHRGKLRELLTKNLDIHVRARKLYAEPS
jgi:hypothetical protein